MVFRALYVINEKGNLVVFKRVFQNIERQEKKNKGDNYRETPSHFASLIIEKLKEKKHQPANSSDNNIPDLYQLYDENLNVVAVKKNDLLYCCILFSNDDLMLDNPGVALALLAIDGFSKVIESAKAGTIREKVSALTRYVLVACPFGVPVELEYSTVQHMLSTITSPINKTSAPVWRPVSNKCRQAVQIYIQEKIRSLKFGRSSIPDVCEIYGEILCKADLDSSQEVSLTLQSPLQDCALSLASYDACVQMVGDLTPCVSNGNNEVLRKLRFSPPYNTFPLSKYKVTLHDNPVHVRYRAKGDENRVEFFIEIGTKSIKSFDHFNVTVPFFNRGKITSFRLSQPSQTVSVDDCQLNWFVDSKFSKDRQMTLEGNVLFDNIGKIIDQRDLYGLTSSYILLSYKVSNYTQSRISIENKSIEVSPNSKFKASVGFELLCEEMKVWNSLAEVIDTTFSSF